MISGIQQIGVGIENLDEAWRWYRKYFLMNIPVFEEKAEAALMINYTGQSVHSRHAVLALNEAGGGGFEIWQFTSRKPQAATFNIEIGDLGIFACKLKTPNAQKKYEYFVEQGEIPLSQLYTDDNGNQHFFVKDPFGNIFQFVESKHFLFNKIRPNGGVYGAILGVSDIEKSLHLYQNILGFNEIVYDQTGLFEDFKALDGGDRKMRRILLRSDQNRKGSFGPLLGNGEIELVQLLEEEGRKIFENRFWGDLGFIHLCFDVIMMKNLQTKLEEAGFIFTVNSENSFDMGEASGQFTYIEDPDGILLEFVETHKIPIIKKLGWYLDLRKKDREKPLPNYILKGLTLNKKRA